jgi:hypothetical protein
MFAGGGSASNLCTDTRKAANGVLRDVAPRLSRQAEVQRTGRGLRLRQWLPTSGRDPNEGRGV